MDRRDFLKGSTGLAAAGLGPFVGMPLARAQSTKDTLVAISESGWNGLDSQVPGAAFPNYGVVWNCYDRLISFGVKKDPITGLDVLDGSKFEPALAEDWNVQGLSATLKLRKDAVFHDGTPVRAADVKWSLDRALGVGGNAKFQLKTGSMEHPEQFVVIDDFTLRIDLPNPNPLLLVNLGMPLINIYNSGLVKSKTTEADPWGLNYTKSNLAGGGAYKIANYTTDTMALVEHAGWKLGKAHMERVVWRVVPSASTRRALLERGDADISIEFPPKDIADMKAVGKLAVYATPLANCCAFVAPNLKVAPFDNIKVRQAIAYAVPYDKILSAALFNNSRLLAGGPAKVDSPLWPQPGPYRYDLAKARQLMAEAGLANGFETTLSFDMGQAGIMEPLSVLVQESLAQIGIKVTLDRIPGSNWRSSFIERKLPLIINYFISFIDYPHYYFDFVYGKSSIFNSMNYESAKLETLLTAARSETDPKKYAALAEQLIQLGFDDLPTIPIYQPYQYVAAQKGLTGFVPGFHRQVDYRAIGKA